MIKLQGIFITVNDWICSHLLYIRKRIHQSAITEIVFGGSYYKQWDDVSIETEKQVAFRGCNVSFFYTILQLSCNMVINDWIYNHLLPPFIHANK